jgi:hypothetical protein
MAEPASPRGGAVGRSSGSPQDTQRFTVGGCPGSPEFDLPAFGDTPRPLTAPYPATTPLSAAGGLHLTTLE